MRSPDDLASFKSPITRRRGITVLIIAVLFILLTSLRSVAVLWTDSLWFDSISQGSVFTGLLTVKVGLAVVFGASFFVVLWGNLLLATRFASRDLTFEPEDELVRWFQTLIRPFARRLYALVALVVGLVAGLSAVPQWQNYILFAHAQSFPGVDPVFHKNIGFYIFRLSFLHFVVTWALMSMVVITLITTFFHYLNGGIRAARVSPRVSPQVKIHISVLLASVAIFKAIDYLLARYTLVTQSNGYVQGATYADIHARMPALTIMFWISLAVAALLLGNVLRQGWSLPVLAAVLWVFVSLTIGVIYPKVIQTFKVKPAEVSLESAYIKRNIEATRAAYGIDTVQRESFAGATSITPADLQSSAATLNNVRLWDPSPNIALETVQRRQAIQSYYTFTSLAVDRYVLDGKVTPVLVGARQLNQNNLPARSWVNQHLEYTHGYGMVVSPANTFDSATGNPTFAVQNVPPTSSNGTPLLTTPGVYFGIDDPGWVVANSKQKELDYKTQAGTPVASNYAGTGGVEMSSFLRRSAFALRFQDLNLWISNQITTKSRMLFERDVLSMAKKAAPFLTFDSAPYAVLANGRVNFVLDGYTTSSLYPYSEGANSQDGAPTGSLTGNYNYVRNSVKVVIDAYDGSVKLYAFDATDPVLAAYRAAFPSLFAPLVDMPSAIRAHLRYPKDLFAIQAAMWGRYHITSPEAFYTASDRWQVSPTTGAGSPKQSVSKTVVTNNVGALVSQTTSQMEPLYQVMALPNTSRQQLTLLTTYVPAGATSTVNGMTSFLIATSDPDNYGQLHAYITPRGTSTTSPIQANAEINQNARVSSIITPLDQHGSKVLLGHNLMVPLQNSILFVRPLYVTNSATPLPQLKYVIAVFNQDVAIETTLQAALSDVLGGNVNGGGGGANSGGTVQSYLDQASAAYAQAQQLLKAGNLAGYQNSIDQMGALLRKAQAALTAAN